MSQPLKVSGFPAFRRDTARPSLERMEFLLELYVSRSAETVARTVSERARAAAEELTRAGTPVCCLRAIFVPDDETCFLLYEADSIGAVCEAACRAGFPYDRIAEAYDERSDVPERRRR